ncbi:MAG: TIGR02444 family protein, partial [Parvularculaceae bacterium]|nr:TIGR02444 family protein [Parvularculaceae bacterium]
MFWAWADDIYRDAHVQELLLRLQDEFALDVGMLLWCVWHAHRFGELDRLTLLHGYERAEKWSGNVTAKLRSVRRELKRDDLAGLDDGVKELRASVATVELAAEKVLFDALERVSRKTGGDPVGQNREGAGRRNLA